jgi:hypothetical protein
MNSPHFFGHLDGVLRADNRVKETVKAVNETIKMVKAVNETVKLVNEGW